MDRIVKAGIWLAIGFAFLLAACQSGGPSGTQPPAIEVPYPPPSPTWIPGNAGYPEPTANMIDWEAAKQMILGGDVARVIQAHSLEVYLVLKDGREFTTIEPEIDDVFEVVDQCGEVCKGIIQVTE
jgi:hypothetical protein